MVVWDGYCDVIGCIGLCYCVYCFGCVNVCGNFGVVGGVVGWYFV